MDQHSASMKSNNIVSGLIKRRSNASKTKSDDVSVKSEQDRKEQQLSTNQTLNKFVSIRSSRSIISILLLMTAISSLVHIAWFHLNSTLKEGQLTEDKIQFQDPLIYGYHNFRDVPHFISSGPHDVNPGIPGMYEFHNVCLTRHAEDETLLGLVYFAPNSDSNVKNNPSRCVPCPLYLFNMWDEVGEGEHELGHKCGFHNFHAMYATSVSDWSACMKNRKNRRFFQEWWGDRGEHFLPSFATEVHLYKEPMIALTHNMNIGHSLFDHLLVYVRHWVIFRRLNKFPFSAVASLTIDQCLSDGTSHWYCELLRAMDAFGGAHEVSVLPKKTTLNCYEKLYIVHLALPRIMVVEKSMPSKEVFDEFRQVMFDKFNLPRDKTFGHSKYEQQALSSKKPTKKVLFYAHEPSGRRVWTNMNELLEKFKKRNRYKDLDFDTVYDFGVLSIQEQARLFNEYDVMIMVHGAQMANSIFTVEGTLFVEVGCAIPEFMGEKIYLSLIGGRYAQVVSCNSSNDDPDSPCVECVLDE